MKSKSQTIGVYCSIFILVRKTPTLVQAPAVQSSYAGIKSIENSYSSFHLTGIMTVLYFSRDIRGSTFS